MDLLKLLTGLILSLSAGASAMTLPSSEFNQLTKLDGTPFQTDKNKVLLYFWATWCPECKEKLSHDFPKLTFPADVELVTVNTDRDMDRIQHALDKENIHLTVVRDNKKAVMAALKVFSVPFWAVLTRGPDQSWQVVESESGGDIEKMKAAWSK